MATDIAPQNTHEKPHDGARAIRRSVLRLTPVNFLNRAVRGMGLFAIAAMNMLSGMVIISFLVYAYAPIDIAESTSGGYAVVRGVSAIGELKYGSQDISLPKRIALSLQVPLRIFINAVLEANFPDAKTTPITPPTGVTHALSGLGNAPKPTQDDKEHSTLLNFHTLIPLLFGLLCCELIWMWKVCKKPGAMACEYVRLLLCSCRNLWLTDSQADASSTSKAVHSVIAGLRGRARVMQLISWLAIALVVATIVAGTLLFYIAGQLTNDEMRGELQLMAQNAGVVAAWTREINNTATELKKSIDARKGVEAEGAKTVLPVLVPPPTREVYLMEMEREDRELSVLRQLDYLFGFPRHDERLGGNLSRFDTKAQQVLSDFDTKHGNYAFMTTSMTRIGAVAMIIFLVRILMQLYSYCARLCAFYQARSEALQLATNAAPAEMAEYLAQLYPTEIGMGKEVSSPISDLRKVLERAVEVIEKRGPTA